LIRDVPFSPSGTLGGVPDAGVGPTSFPQRRAANLTEWVQAVAAVTASVGGLIVASLAIKQWMEANKHREEALRWMQEQQSRKVLDDLFLGEGHNGYFALIMADLRAGADECRFEDDWIRSKVQVHTINHQQVMAALQATPPPDDRAAFIQGCFDDLFYYLERIDLYLEKNFVRFEDVRSPLVYYAEQVALNTKVYRAYIRKIRADGAGRLLDRFDADRVRERGGLPDAPPG